MKILDAIQNFSVKKTFLFLLIVGLLVYGNSLLNGFVWDDEEQIVNNSIIHSLSNFPHIFSGATFNSGGAGLSGWFFRPFLTFLYMLNFSLWGSNPFGFHLFQVIFHFLNSFLIFKIINALGKDLKIPAFFAAILFILHPAINEAVVYVAALSEVIYTFFNLLALYLLVSDSKFSKPWLILTLLFLALLNKESAIVMIPILWLFVLIFRTSQLKKWTFYLLGLGGAYFFLRLFIVKTPIRHPEFAPISESPLIHRLMTIPSEFGHYLKIIFYPHDLAISRHFVVTDFGIFNFFIPLIIISLFIAAWIWFIIRFKSKLALLGILWFLIGFGLISNIFPLDMTVAERWLYFPFIGLILGFSALLSKIPLNKKYLYLALLVFCLLLGIRSFIRNTNWQNGLTLFSHDIKYSLNSFDLENNLGVELFRIGKIDEAKVHFERSIELQPKWHFAYNNLGAVYNRKGDLGSAKKYYQKTLELSDYYLAVENLAALYYQKGPLEEAKLFSQEYLKKLPNNSKLWLILAITNYKLGDKEAALDGASKAFRLSPNQETYYIYTQLQQGKELLFNAQ